MYAKIVSGGVVQFPYSIGDLTRENPQTSFPDAIGQDVLAAFDVYPVAATTAPAIDSKTHRYVTSVAQVDGVWTQQWAAQQLPESSAAGNVRAFRDARLAQSDWTQVADAPVDKAAWATYRQALRDVTTQLGFPWDVQWPVAP
jgi:hypothetical protein